MSRQNIRLKRKSQVRIYTCPEILLLHSRFVYDSSCIAVVCGCKLWAYTYGSICLIITFVYSKEKMVIRPTATRPTVQCTKRTQDWKRIIPLDEER